MGTQMATHQSRTPGCPHRNHLFVNVQGCKHGTRAICSMRLNAARLQVGAAGVRLRLRQQTAGALHALSQPGRQRQRHGACMGRMLAHEGCWPCSEAAFGSACYLPPPRPPLGCRRRPSPRAAHLGPRLLPGADWGQALHGTASCTLWQALLLLGRGCSHTLRRPSLCRPPGSCPNPTGRARAAGAPPLCLPAAARRAAHAACNSALPGLAAGLQLHPLLM